MSDCDAIQSCRLRAPIKRSICRIVALTVWSSLSFRDRGMTYSASAEAAEFRVREAGDASVCGPRCPSRPAVLGERSTGVNQWPARY